MAKANAAKAKVAKANALPRDTEEVQAPRSNPPGRSLRDIQDRFQAALLSGDDAVLADILDNSRTGRDVLLGVYRHAYVGRLIEVVAHDHEVLQTYLGGEGFEAMARAYIAAYPSRTQNARWVSKHLPAFLSTTAPYSEHPQICGLAVIEAALNTAFDAADGPVIGLEQLAAIAPELWGSLVFQPHPAACRFAIGSNALDIWHALRSGGEPPEPQELTGAQQLLVWRQGATPMIRTLGAEEAMMWDEAAKGLPFSGLCEMVATFDRPDEAAIRAAQYLGGWLAAGLLSSVRQQPPRKRSRS